MAKKTYQGDCAMKPSVNHSAPPETAERGLIYLLELPETPAMAVGKLRVASGDWFHCVQMESIGIAPRTLRPRTRD
jgi:hypothetical protein